MYGISKYGKFDQTYYRDTVITCLVNTATCLLAGTVTFSILGHMAFNQGVDVKEVTILLYSHYQAWIKVAYSLF